MVYYALTDTCCELETIVEVFASRETRDDWVAEYPKTAEPWEIDPIVDGPRLAIDEKAAMRCLEYDESVDYDECAGTYEECGAFDENGELVNRPYVVRMHDGLSIQSYNVKWSARVLPDWLKEALGRWYTECGHTDGITEFTWSYYYW